MIAPDNVDFAGDIDFRETLEERADWCFPGTAKIDPARRSMWRNG